MRSSCVLFESNETQLFFLPTFFSLTLSKCILSTLSYWLNIFTSSRKLPWFELAADSSSPLRAFPRRARYEMLSINLVKISLFLCFSHTLTALPWISDTSTASYFFQALFSSCLTQPLSKQTCCTFLHKEKADSVSLFGEYPNQGLVLYQLLWNDRPSSFLGHLSTQNTHFDIAGITF